MTTSTPARNGRLRFNSVQARIAAMFLVVGLGVCTLTAWNHMRMSMDLANHQVARTALQTNTLLAATAADPLRIRATGRLATIFEPFTSAREGETTFAVAFSRDAQPLIQGGYGPDVLDPLQVLAARAMSEAMTVASSDGMMVATPVFETMSDKAAGAVATAWSAADVIARQRQSTRVNGLLAVGVVLVALIATMAAVRRWISRPIGELSRIVDRMAAEDYGADFAVAARGDELGDIGTALSHLCERLKVARNRERENRFRGTAFEASSAAVMMVDSDFRICSVNAANLDLLHKYEADFRVTTPLFDPDAIVGEDMDFFHAGALKGRVRAMLLDPANLPYRAEIAVGDARFRLTISRVETDDGALDGFVVEWDDVTADFMNQAIQASLADNQIQAEFTVGGAFLSGNALMSQAIGRSADELAGEPGDQIFDFDKALARSRGTVFEQVNDGKAVNGRFRLRRADGGVALVEGGFSPVQDARGNLLRILLIGKDITEAQEQLKRAEKERARLQAEQAQVVDSLRLALSHLADGDLTARIDTEFAPDYDRLRVDFNEAVARLQAAMQGVIENAQLIRGEAGEISSAADDLSTRTERQAATLEETAAALDELTASVRSSADGARNANTLVDTARNDAEASGSVVREAVGAMGEIETSSRQISKITDLIDDIAFQTNLLALNAGVEAARAGDAGRGFAVVASEVRALAQRSSEAAREINTLISTSDGHVRRGVELVDKAGTALDGIVVSVRKISQNVAEIAVSSQEQSAGLAEINAAMNQLDQVTQQNAAMFEQTTAASHALTREAETLTQTMARFRTARKAAAATPDNVLAPSFSTRRKTSAAAGPAHVDACVPTPAATAANGAGPGGFRAPPSAI